MREAAKGCDKQCQRKLRKEKRKSRKNQAKRKSKKSRRLVKKSKTTKGNKKAKKGSNRTSKEKKSKTKKVNKKAKKGANGAIKNSNVLKTASSSGNGRCLIIPFFHMIIFFSPFLFVNHQYQSNDRHLDRNSSTCFTDLIAKTKKFNKAQVEFRLAKRVQR